MKFLHSKSRLESVRVAVFAFAATLMVVNIGSDTAITSFREEVTKSYQFCS